jgi:hypothetical protein
VEAHVDDGGADENLDGGSAHAGSPPFDGAFGGGEADDTVGGVLADGGVGLAGGVLGDHEACGGVVVG